MPVRVTTIHPGASGGQAAANYYTRYLTEAGEAPGQWAGEQADRLGVTGNVEGWQLAHLLAGRHPVTGMALGMAICDRTDANGRLRLGVSGFDVTFSAPKGASVLGLVYGWDDVLDAHRAAVAEVIGHVNRYGTTCRVGPAGGQVNVDTGGGVFAVFEQHTSRAGDPQLHTHVVVSNKVLRPDGKWGAIDGLYVKKQQQTLSGLYHRTFEAELTARLPGLLLQERVNGVAELASPIAGREPDWAALLGQFSKRTDELRDQFDAELTAFRVREGRDPSRYERAAIERQSALDSRPFKEHPPTTGPQLADAWRFEAEQVGWAAQDLDVGLQRSTQRTRRAERTVQHEPAPDVPIVNVPVLDGGVVAALGDEDAAVLEVALSRASTWNRAQALRVLTEHASLPHGIGAGGARRLLEATIDRFLAERCVSLDPPLPDTAARRVSDGRLVAVAPTASQYTTEAILVQEETIAARFIDCALDPHPAPHGPAWDDTVAAAGLDDRQARAAGLVAGRAPVGIVVGPAGTGKTTAMRTAVQQLVGDGRGVVGAAPTARAAAELGVATGMRADALAKLLYEHTPVLHHPSRTDHRPGAEWELGAGGTVIVDEASMVPTADLYRLMQLADQEQWRVVLVGDPFQLAAVGRGGMFGELCATTPTVELVAVHRFAFEWERVASLELRRAEPSVLDTYLAEGRVHGGLLDEHLPEITAVWMRATLRGESVAVTVSTNDEVATVNAAVQQARVKNGDLNRGYAVPIGAGEQAMPGDVVQTRLNDRLLRTTRGLPVLNRQTWEVQATNRATGALVVSAAEVGTVELSAEYVGAHVRLAYAATAYGTQGLTVDYGILIAGQATDHATVYEGMTRGRARNDVYVITPEPALHPDTAGDAVELLGGALHRHRGDVAALTVRRDLALTAGTTPRPAARPANVSSSLVADRLEGLLAGVELASLLDEREHLTRALAAARAVLPSQQRQHEHARNDLAGHDRTTERLERVLARERSSLDRLQHGGPLYRARRYGNITATETLISGLQRDLLRHERQRPALAADHTNAATELARTERDLQRHSRRLDTITATLTRDATTRSVAPVAPMLLDRVEDLIGPRPTAQTRTGQAAVWERVCAVLLQEAEASGALHPDRLRPATRVVVRETQRQLDWDPTIAWERVPAGHPRHDRVERVRTAALAGVATIDTLHTETVTALNTHHGIRDRLAKLERDRDRAAAEVAAITRTIDSVRDQPHKWVAIPAAANNQRLREAAQILGRAIDHVDDMRSDLEATRGPWKGRAERRLLVAQSALTQASANLNRAINEILPTLTQPAEQAWGEARRGHEQLRRTLDPNADRLDERLELLEHAIAHGNGAEHATPSLRSRAAEIDTELDRHPEHATELGPIRDYLANILGHRDDLQRDELALTPDLLNEPDMQHEHDLARDIDHAPTIERGHGRGIGLHM